MPTHSVAHELRQPRHTDIRPELWAIVTELEALIERVSALALDAPEYYEAQLLDANGQMLNYGGLHLHPDGAVPEYEELLRPSRWQVGHLPDGWKVRIINTRTGQVVKEHAHA